MRRFTEIAEMSPEGQPVALRFLCLQLSRVASIQIVSTFFILFLLDVITFKELGLLLAIQLGVIAVLDYPTGALGDWIGHKWVLFLAYCCYAATTMSLLLAHSFEEFLLCGLFLGIAFSQESGALEAWFDNNYRATTGVADPDRVIYGAFQGKVVALVNLISGAAFILGGLIATAFSRRSLFLIQLCLISIVLMLIVLLMNNVEDIEAPQKSLKTYGEQLTGGLRFVASDRGVLFYMLGYGLLMGAIISWGTLMLFPFYESYSGSDSYTGLLRAIIFITGIFWQVVAAGFSRNVHRVRRGIFVTSFMGSTGFFVLAFLYYKLVPPTNVFVLSTYIGVIVVCQVVYMWVSLEDILRSRLVLEIVPDRYRNAIYSLLSTLIVSFGAPLLIFSGFIIETFDFAMGFLALAALTCLAVLINSLGLYWLPEPGTGRLPSPGLEDEKA